MKKVVIHKPGGYEQLRVESAPDPSPSTGEVLVETRAIGVNYADVAIRMGLYASAKKYVGWPITPGFEFCGRVAALGDGIDDLGVGDEVIGVTRFGGYASHLTVPRHQLFPKPEGFSTADAGGFCTAFLTAYYMLFEQAHPRSGRSVLVHSAAGGVGSALVQLAALKGCTVVGVVGGPHKVAPCRTLGAAEVIDRSSEPLWPRARKLARDGYAAIFDANGGRSIRDSYRHLAPGGKLVIYGFHTMLPRGKGRPDWLKLAWDWLLTPRFSPLRMTNDNRSVLACNLSYLFPEKDLLQLAMRDLLAWAADGKIKPSRTETYPLAEAARAHRDIESGTTVGKLVLVP